MTDDNPSSSYWQPNGKGFLGGYMPDSALRKRRETALASTSGFWKAIVELCKARQNISESDGITLSVSIREENGGISENKLPMSIRDIEFLGVNRPDVVIYLIDEVERLRAIVGDMPF